MSKKKISIIGAGGHSCAVIDVLLEKYEKKNLEVFDISTSKKDKKFLGIKIKKESKIKFKNAFIAIGNNKIRKNRFNTLKKNNNLINVISDSVKFCNNVKIGMGNFIGKLAFLGAQVKIGNNNIINNQCSIEHETIVGDHCHFAPRSIIGGWAKIGNNVFVGLGSKINNGVKICDNCIIGSNSVVIQDIKEPGTYVGSPVRKVKKVLHAKKNILNKKIIVATYGEVGITLLQYLFKIGFKKENLIIFTHKFEKNNDNFLRFIQYIKLSTVFDDEKISSIKDKFTKFNPDLLFSFHFRKKIDASLLNIPRYKSINLHPSLLPKYAGCFSSVWAILNGEEETGISYHYMTKKFDSGNVIFQEKIFIDKKDTSYSLFYKLLFLSLENITNVLELIFNKKFKGFEQNLNLRTYYSRKIPYKGFINLKWSLEKIERFIRSMYFPPFKGACLKKDKKVYEITSFKKLKKHLN